MRIYISGATTGQANYLRNFMKAQEALEKNGHSAVNPTWLEHVARDLTYEEYMKIDLALLDMCDAIYMLQGWQESKGANREYGFALGKDMLVMFEEKEKEDVFDD